MSAFWYAIPMYTPEGNYDPNRRPTNAQLSRWASMQCAASILTAATVFAVLYVLISGAPHAVFSITFAVIGSVAGLIVFLPLHARSGKRKRAAYEAAGGNTAGMTDWMLGAMGGHTADDGRWEWFHPETPGSSN